MRRVSMVVPVCNEEFLLPIFLDGVIDVVDEVVIVDGGVQGKSIDGTAGIISAYGKEKLKYVDTKVNFVLDSGGWDRASQVNLGIEKATGDIIIHSSVDVVFRGLEKLVSEMAAGEEQIYRIPSVQFWLDTRHVRLDGGSAHKTDLFAVAVDCHPTYSESGFGPTEEKGCKPAIVWSVDSTRYHLGWIRPFARQVRKHIHNIKTGAWGETGEKVVALGEEAIEAWAIHHILRYGNGDFAPILRVNGIPDSVRNMKCTDGLDRYIEQYQQRAGQDFYLGIMSAIPPELIVG